MIHPFSDGNGRIGRLWHTLLLSKWNSVFAWLPIESIIHDSQQEYYDAINASNNAAESTEFIAFMLSAIKSSITEALSMSDEMIDEKDSEALRVKAVISYLNENESICNSDVCKLLSVSSATANRMLRKCTENGILEKFRKGKT